MTRPLVSVILETVTAQTSVEGGSIADRLAKPLVALRAQTYEQERIEPIIVVGIEVPEAERMEIARRYPQARIASARAGNYFDAKNQGAAAARGEVVTFLDGDCTPEPDWLETLVRRFEPGVDAVAGCVRYEPKNAIARALSVPDFGYILEEKGGLASGFNLGNVAFRRDLFLANPLDARLVRNGGCYNLFHQLREKGARIVYEGGARVSHALDFEGLGFFKKHWARGYDGLEVYRFDRVDLFRGTNWYRRFGVAALIALSGRRILVDWRRLARHRRQIGVPVPALPLYGLLAVMLRGAELAGAIAAHFAEPAAGNRAGLAAISGG